MKVKKSPDELQAVISQTASIPQLLQIISEEIKKLTPPETTLRNWSKIEEKFPSAAFIRQRKEERARAIMGLKAMGYNRIVELCDDQGD